MTVYAVIDNNKVVNTIVADSLEIAQELTKLQCVDITNVIAGIDWDYVDGNFIDNRPKPEPVIIESE